MTLNETKRLSKHICRLLKVSEITLPIGRTPKGNLGITFNANNEDYEIMLDAIPLSTKDSLHDENNIELKVMLEKYLFDTEKVAIFSAPQPASAENLTITALPSVSQEQPGVKVAKKPGRPRKNANTTTKESS